MVSFRPDGFFALAGIDSQPLLLVGAWLCYFAIHSLLASLGLKRLVARRWPALMPAYRLLFNLQAILLLIPPLYLTYQWDGPFLWRWIGAGWWLANGLALLGLGLFFWSLRYYDSGEFLGLKQWRERQRRVEDQERFHISPLHRFVRHPWYSLGLVLFGVAALPAGWLGDVWSQIGMMVIFFLGIVFFAPDAGGLFLEPRNFEPANPLKTPEHIAPVWYFTPFYAMLRAVPPMFNSQFPGVVVMFAAIIILFFMPWLDRSPVKSIRYKGMLFKIAIAVFVVTFVVLAWLGMQASTPTKTLLAQIFTALYFAFFLLMPIYSKMDKTKPVPERVTK